VGEKQAPHTSAPPQAANNQETGEPAIVSAVFVLVLLAVVFVFVLCPAPLVEQVSEKQAPHTSAPPQAANNQEAGEPAIVSAVFVLILLLVVFVFVLCPAPLAEQVSEKQAPHTSAPPQAANNQEASEPVIIPAVLVLVLVLVVLVFVLFLAPLAEQVGEHQAPQTPAPQ
jgi:heme/copper-type cytochrome/quinol oxidase subunit 2